MPHPRFSLPPIAADLAARQGPEPRRPDHPPDWVPGAATSQRRLPRHRSSLRLSDLRILLICGLAWSAGILPGLADETAAAPAGNGRSRSFVYYRDIDPDIPWSIHVVKVARNDPAYRLTTTLGRGEVLGMGHIAEQLAGLPPQWGRPLAAVNGDFYQKDEDFPGRPRDLQIRHGELISPPAGHAVFWIDRDGNPHMTNVASRFRVRWPDGSTTPVGLNEWRRPDTAVLYTAVTGASTGTTNGTELRLEPAQADGPWLPLRIGRRYPARVCQVLSGGNASLNLDSMVLSLGPDLLSKVPDFEAGTTHLEILTESLPDLAQAQTAIGGGPTLVRDGQPGQWNWPIQLRHPRSAVGWNDDYFFLVEVDGRQLTLSVGMTFPELAAYMIKLGCHQAMNLDGGGSATLWVLGDVVNSPSEGAERPGANALVIVKSEAGP